MLSIICKKYISILHFCIQIFIQKKTQDIDKILNTFFFLFLLLLERGAHKAKLLQTIGFPGLGSSGVSQCQHLDRENLTCDIQGQPDSNLPKRENSVSFHSYTLRKKQSKSQNFRALVLSS